MFDDWVSETYSGDERRGRTSLEEKEEYMLTTNNEHNKMG